MEFTEDELKRQEDAIRAFVETDPHVDAIIENRAHGQRLYRTNKPRRLTRPGVIGPMMREIGGVLYQGEIAQGVENLARLGRKP